jgi:hypothetical protein
LPAKHTQAIVRSILAALLQRARRKDQAMDDAPRDPDSKDVEIDRELTGDQQLGDQRAFVREDEVDETDRVTDTEVYEGEDPADLVGSLDLLTTDGPRAGETDDAYVAAQEGLTWIPPTDPPLADSTDEDDVAGRVRDALRADAATNRYADEIAIGAVGSRVALRGVVDDIEDSDSLLEVAGRVQGVSEVIDELEVSSLR